MLIIGGPVCFVHGVCCTVCSTDCLKQNNKQLSGYSTLQIANLNQLAKNKVELGKALLRAAEKATKGSEEKAKEPETGTGSTDKNNKKRKKAS